MCLTSIYMLLYTHWSSTIIKSHLTMTDENRGVHSQIHGVEMFSVSPGLGCCVSTWNGDGSKPWYLVNIKIAGKWMFIPLKLFIYRYWPIPKSINDSWEIHPLNWWKSWLSFHWTWPNFQAQARISLLLLCSIIEIKTPNKSRIQCFRCPQKVGPTVPSGSARWLWKITNGKKKWKINQKKIILISQF